MSQTSSSNAAGVPQAPTKVTEDSERSKCMTRLEYTISGNRHAQIILDGITNLGCALPPNFFVCRKCESEMTGGFLLPQKGSAVYNPKIIMCENKEIDKRMFQNTVVHELIHAYDVCRAKVDWTDCRHFACTEIRASALSGECNMMREMYRGRFVFDKGHQECVKRRAALSLASHKKCKEHCDEDVRNAFNDCYKDTSPFLEIP